MIFLRLFVSCGTEQVCSQEEGQGQGAEKQRQEVNKFKSLRTTFELFVATARQTLDI